MSSPDFRSPIETTDALHSDNASPSSSNGINRGYLLLSLIVIAVVSFFYFGILDTEMLGFTHDDGVYAIAAKSIAEGKGFQLLHVIGQPAQIKYPFMYPFLLSWVWRINPNFPDNLGAMNMLTLAFSLGGLWLTFLYLRQCQRFPGWLALLITALIPCSFFFMYFFSTIMSEGPYLFFSMLLLWYFHRATQHEKKLTANTLAVLILLSSVTFLTRVLGLALMGAIGTWFLLNRQWKNTLIYGAGCLITGVLPWFLWVKFNGFVVTEFSYPLANTYSNYGREFLHNLTTTNYLRGLGMDLFSLICKLLEDMFPIFPNLLKVYPQILENPMLANTITLGTLGIAYLLFGYYLLQLISTLRKSWQKDGFHPEAFSVPALYLFYYMLIITLWHYEDQMARFLTVLLPLLWLYLFKPMLRWLPDVGRPLPPNRIKMIGAILLTIVIATASVWMCNGSYRTMSVSRNQHWVESGKYRWLWGEYKDTFAWINENLPKNARLAATSDVVFYLYTNRPTFYVFFASLRRENGVFREDSFQRLLNSLDHYGVNYLVAEPHMQARVLRFPVNVVAQELLDRFPERFERVYQSPRGPINVYRILPPSSAAPQPKKQPSGYWLPPQRPESKH